MSFVICKLNSICWEILKKHYPSLECTVSSFYDDGLEGLVLLYVFICRDLALAGLILNKEVLLYGAFYTNWAKGWGTLELGKMRKTSREVC